MFTPLPPHASRRLAAVLLLASLTLNLLPAASPASAAAARRAPAQASAAPFVRVLNLPVNDIAYDRQSLKLFASVPSRAGAGGNSVTEIDPATGAVGTSVPTGAGTEPDKLALSDDGQVLYLGYNGINSATVGPGAVRRFDIGTQTLGPNISLGADPNFGGAQWAYDIAVAPGNPNLIAVARYTLSSPPQKGVAIFDNGVQLPKTTPGHSEGSVSVAFSASPATLYGGSTETGLKTINVDSTGATVTGTAHYRLGPAIEFRNGLLYSGQGHVVNPATGALLGRFNSSVSGRAMVIDPALNRAFFATGSDTSSGPITITAYDLTTFAPVGRVTLPFVGVPTRLVRWGVNGLAVRAAGSSFSGFDSKLYLIESALVSAAAPVPTGVQLAATAQSVPENSGSATVSVIRTGDLSAASTVEYATADGTASERSDYTTALGTLRFAPGESSKTVQVLVTNDAHQEGNETFSLTLGGVSGAELLSPASSTVTIQDNDFSPQQVNPVDNTTFFVRQHYRDFLNRDPDAAGLAFWIGGIASCGADLQCREVKRIDTSAAFFLSIEFQETGYLAYRTYKAAYGDATSSGVPGTVPVIRLREFLADAQRIGQNVQVGVGDWQQQLEANKSAYTLDFVRRARFRASFPATMTAEEFVTRLSETTGAALSPEEKAAHIATLGATPGDEAKRAQVLRAVAEDADLRRAELNRAFVLMQYYGYMRRNPDDPQDTNFGGWRFWLDKLEQFNGNFVEAEMVKAFITSIEYRQRFGQ